MLSKSFIAMIDEGRVQGKKHGLVFGIALYLFYRSSLPIIFICIIFTTIYSSVNIIALEFWRSHPIIFVIYTLWWLVLINYICFVQIGEKLSTREFQNIYYVHKKISQAWGDRASFYDVLTLSLMNVVVFAGIYNVNGFLDNGNLIYGEFVDALYFSLVTWTTLGYGDLQPEPSIRFLASLEALMGYMYMAFLIGCVFSEATRNQRWEADMNEVILFDIQDVLPVIKKGEKRILVEFGFDIPDDEKSVEIPDHIRAIKLHYLDRDKKYVCFKVFLQREIHQFVPRKLRPQKSIKKSKGELFIDSNTLNKWYSKGQENYVRLMIVHYAELKSLSDGW